MRSPFLFLLSICTITFQAIAQDIVFEKEIKLHKVFNERRESYPYFNENDRELSLFLMDNKDIFAYSFDRDFNEIGDFLLERPDNKFKHLLGSSYKDGKHYLFFTNGKKNQFFIQSIDITAQKLSSKETDLTLQEEEFLETVSYKGKFYLMTVVNNTSIIKIYVFDQDQIEKIQEVDLSSYIFSSKPGYKLYNTLFKVGSDFRQEMDITKIDFESPNPIDLTSKKFKLYQINNKIYITLDNDSYSTKIILIDILTFEYDVSYVVRPKLECDGSGKTKSNSYLYGDILYQINASKKCLNFSVHNHLSKSLIKQFGFSADEDISFKNSPVIQEGGLTIYSANKNKELEKTSLILKRIMSGDLGLSAYFKNDEIQITLGGIKEIKSSGGGGWSGTPGSSISTPYGPVAAPSTYSYNPTMNSYSNYSFSRSIYFKTLLEKKSFEHLKKPLEDNVFDKIKQFLSGNEERYISETVFKIQNNFFVGYYDKEQKKYFIRVFSE